ncbi:hypothetical protein GCM10010172_31690 [Paractinoplanes ferrugineus]|uniref:Uncharacterized protein n=1 Tax=Paractinoplanes ferrugineus TaxID=113564 RepID=A0A919J7N5_9ACTN|nr:hypothetical protein Afe05nite_59790 [Actinoplanes ferrugineus]
MNNCRSAVAGSLVVAATQGRGSTAPPESATSTSQAAPVSRPRRNAAIPRVTGTGARGLIDATRPAPTP